MAIADLGRPTRTTKGPQCDVCRKLDELDADEATALRKHLADPDWRYSSLSEALEGEGVNLSAHSLARHARGKCAARERLRLR